MKSGNRIKKSKLIQRKKNAQKLRRKFLEKRTLFVF
jgi:hypothetical protein